MSRIFRVLGLIAVLGLALSIYGGTSSTSSDPNTLSKSNTFRHVGVILFVALYGLIVIAHAVCWVQADKLMKHRKALLIGISSALPFLGVRLIYAVLSSFSGSLVPSATSKNTNSLAKFNMATGEWWIYLVMGLLMEYIVVIIYTAVGIRVPLQSDYHANDTVGPSDQYAAHGQNGGYAPPTYPPQSRGAYA